MSAAPFEAQQVRRGEFAAFALALALLVLALLAEPIAKLGTHAYSTGDLANLFALLEQDAAHVPANRLVSDPAFQMQPWTKFICEELAHGRVPLWNPYSGCGEPLVANYQSALLSPFQLPFYALPFALALVVSAFLKLYVLGLFTWLFLRRIGVSALPAAFGAFAFAFGGHNVLLLGYPHPGALAVLPAGLWCAEGVLQACERGKRALGAHVALALAVGLAALSGHPEPFFFGVVLVAAWSVWRATHVLRARGARGALHALVGIALAGCVGMCIAAPQVLPFLEYLRHASALSSRLHNQEAFEFKYLPLWVYPMLLGNPASPYLIDVRVPPPNYEGANMSYPGALVLLAGLVALAALRGDKRVRFFGVVVIAWFLYAYDVAGIGAAASHVPILSSMPINRSQPLWLFAIAALGALGMQRAFDSRVAAHAERHGAPRAELGGDAGSRTRWGVGVAIVACGLALWLAALAGADHLLVQNGDRVRPATQMSALLPAHVREITVSFALGVLALALVHASAARRVRAASCAVLALLAFHQGGWIHRDYTPTIEQRYLFPRTRALEPLLDAVGSETVAVLGESVMAAELNVAYRLSLLSNYDAMGVADFDRFLHQNFAAYGSNKDARTATSNALAVAGVRWIVARGAWPPVDSLLGEQLFRLGQKGAPLALESGVELVQEFDVPRAGLRGLLVYAGSYAAGRDRTLSVRLEHAQRGVVFEQELALSERLARSRDPEELPGEFARPPEVSACAHPLELPDGLPAGRYRLRLACANGAPRACPVVWLSSTLVVPGGKLGVSGAARAGNLYFDGSFALPRLEQAAELRHLRLFRDRDGLGRYYTVGASEGVATTTDALRRLLDPAYVARSCVLLEGEVRARGGSDEPARSVRIVREEPCRIELEAERSTSGYLVICNARCPGWKARVDGVAAELLPANGAFSALALEPGKHAIELVYDPLSWKLGCAVGALAALCTCAAAWLALRGARRP